MSSETGSKKRGSRAAVALGLGSALLGAALGLASIYMALNGEALWLLLTLPAVFLVALGVAIHANRFEVGHVPRPVDPSDPSRMHRVRDYAHNNQAWENVSRWKRKYGGGRPGGGTEPRGDLKK